MRSILFVAKKSLPAIRFHVEAEKLDHGLGGSWQPLGACEAYTHLTVGHLLNALIA